MDQAGGDLAEHRLAFLLSDVFLQLHEAIGHRVEGVAELVDLVLAADRDALVHAALGDRLGGAGEREDAGDEAAAPQPAEDHRAEQREADGDEELSAEAASAVRRLQSVGCSTMTTHGRFRDWRAGGEQLRARWPRDTSRCAGRVGPAAPSSPRRTTVRERGVAERLRDSASLVRIAVRDEPLLFGQQECVALLADSARRSTVLHSSSSAISPTTQPASCPAGEILTAIVVRGRLSSSSCSGAI